MTTPITKVYARIIADPEGEAIAMQTDYCMLSQAQLAIVALATAEAEEVPQLVKFITALPLPFAITCMYSLTKGTCRDITMAVSHTPEFRSWVTTNHAALISVLPKPANWRALR